jgi:hypothetical protein
VQGIGRGLCGGGMFNSPQNRLAPARQQPINLMASVCLFHSRFILFRSIEFIFPFTRRTPQIIKDRTTTFRSGCHHDIILKKYVFEIWSSNSKKYVKKYEARICLLKFPYWLNESQTLSFMDSLCSVEILAEIFRAEKQKYLLCSSHLDQKF